MVLLITACVVHIYMYIVKYDIILVCALMVAHISC